MAWSNDVQSSTSSLRLHQEYVIDDYKDTFTLNSRQTSFRMLLVVATTQQWNLHKMDMKNAFSMETYLRKCTWGILLAFYSSRISLSSPSSTLWKNMARELSLLSSTPVSPIFLCLKYTWFCFICLANKFVVVFLFFFVSMVWYNGRWCQWTSWAKVLLARAIWDEGVGSLTYFLGIEVNHRGGDYNCSMQNMHQNCSIKHN